MAGFSYAIIGMVILTSCFALDAHADSRAEFLCNFLAGNYTIIGGSVGGSRTYKGNVSIICKADHSLAVKRVVHGESVEMNGWIESITADSIPVVKIIFKEAGRRWSAVYDICSTVGNHPRLTGYLKTLPDKDVRMEALFYKNDGVQVTLDKISDNMINEFIGALKDPLQKKFLEKFKRENIHDGDAVMEIIEEENCYRVVVIYAPSGGWHAFDAEFEINKKNGKISMISHGDPQPDAGFTAKNH